MKIFLLLSVWLFISANADSSERRPWEEDLEDFAKVIKDRFNVTMGYVVIKLLKVVEGKCPTIAEKMEFASDEYVKCMSGKVFGSETLCSAVRNNWATCSKPGVDAISNCLPDDKDFPIMIGKITGALIGIICDSTGSEVLEFFHPCINAISSRNIPECAETVRLVHKPKKNTLPTKETICLLIQELDKCSQAHKRLSCSHIPKRDQKGRNYILEALKDDCAPWVQA